MAVHPNQGLADWICNRLLGSSRGHAAGGGVLKLVADISKSKRLGGELRFSRCV